MNAPLGGSVPHRRRRARSAWSRVFWIGLLLWLATVVITLLTRNTNLVPTIVLLGSFLVPVTFVVWAYERARSDEVSIVLMVRAFIIGGLIGVLGASVLESYLLRPNLFLFLGVGLIEEAVKILAAAIVARHLTRYTVRDGLLLGAAVGFGFAAFESAGYALSAVITERGLDIMAVVQVEVLRGMLSPFMHGLWTAIAVAALFQAAHGRRYRVTGWFLLVYLGVSVLHAVWDAMHPFVTGIVLLLTGTQAQLRLVARDGNAHFTSEQQAMVGILYALGLLVVILVNLLWLRYWANRAQRVPE
ncbi:PrsW family intramembrane metalloprotease [Spiractinospora alimapuensis]|uniref:PrsW family intramembrane metalloprotease n=1 Tax=Spiractinospora alimapuensis TaxID=2820884 RepID=UPI001F1DADBF|nr:PrsW family intramembrane metalloprotease [Spiractinospora alimapuensis]QVQ54949.1 PrsW family intramembrane metalloprotease [Spiractinospora alimapuensis]